jgi:hypothetical protein
VNVLFGRPHICVGKDFPRCLVSSVCLFVTSLQTEDIGILLQDIGPR